MNRNDRKYIHLIEGIQGVPQCYGFGNKCENISFNAYAFTNKSNNIYGVMSGRCSPKTTQYAMEKIQDLFIMHHKCLNVKNALKKSFDQLDQKVKEFNEFGGLSLVFLYYCQPLLHLAYVGKCQAYAITADDRWINMAPVQHTTSNTDECKRIHELHTKMKNFMITEGKTPLINDKLSITRSIGDKPYNDILISDPEYRVFDSKVEQLKHVFLASEFFEGTMEDIKLLYDKSRSSRTFSKNIISVYRNNTCPMAGLLMEIDV